MFVFLNSDLNSWAFQCSRLVVHPLLGPNGGPWGGDHFYLGARKRPLGRVSKKRGSRGGPLGRPRSLWRAPSAILKLLENHCFSSHVEPLNPSDAAKGTKQNAKWWTLMQVKSRHYKESRRKKMAAPSEPKKKPTSVYEHKTRVPKSYTHH